MTEISFYFNVPSRTAYACRLVRRAHRQGMAVAVAGPADALDEIDHELWSFAAVEFLAHSRIERAGEVPEPLRATTIWLGENPIDAPLHGALLNLGPLPPPAFETFERLFEVVSLEESDREAARARWKTYARRGYPIKRHEVAA
ncbi:MAG: DNA polymerase III subunit chi [Rhizobacter sp.]|nr:DNA polymerase III subunit chi [Rhizobacter sp.]